MRAASGTTERRTRKYFSQEAINLEARKISNTSKIGNLELNASHAAFLAQKCVSRTHYRALGAHLPSAMRARWRALLLNFYFGVANDVCVAGDFLVDLFGELL